MPEQNRQNLIQKIEQQQADIAHLKSLNQDLSVRLTQLSSLLDNIPGMAFRCLCDADLTFEYASKGSRTILGYSPEQIVNVQAFRRLVHKEDQARNIAVIENLRPTNNRYEIIYRMRASWGEYRWIIEQGTAIFTEDGTLEAIDGLLTDITDQKNKEIKLREENSRLRFSTKERFRLGELIGKSKPIQDVYERIIRAAGTNVPIIIHGESGTGKELASRTIHELSDRRTKPFIAVNCGAIAENLMESEFFGHLRGAFTGAHSDREGFLMAADGGTLFLDEIGEMSIPLQIKLLRVLDGGGFVPVGSNKRYTSNFRLLSATNRDLGLMVRTGRMREDFYYRINTVPILMPPLRNRLEDLPLLVDHFLTNFSEEMGEEIHISSEFYLALENHLWPGNVRELFNVIRRYITLKEISFNPSISVSTKDSQEFRELNTSAHQTSDKPVADELHLVERSMIIKALQENKYHMGRTAATLGISRRTLQRRVNKYNLKEHR